MLLVSQAGELLGLLPPLELVVPYWPECADLVAAVQARFGAQVTVLRLLCSDLSRGPGGDVSYLAELAADAPSLPLLPVSEELRELALRRDARRMPWAELGGPARSLEWARRTLEPFGHGSFQAVQQRSWNLSSLWRLEPILPDAGQYWLKEVPAFLKHEAAVLRWLQATVPGAAPRLLAADDAGRSLLAHVEGEDLYGASVDMRRLILACLHDLQCVAASAAEELVALGIPDLRGSRRAADHAGKIQAWLPDFPGLDALLQRLQQDVARLDESGLPATLVHVDNHPGNARLSPSGVTILDWGEAFVGNPVTDILSLCAGLEPGDAAALCDQWCGLWKEVAPRSKPELALESAPFVAAMQGAATYAHFLNHLEETEWPYHREDVPRCLREADSFAKNR